MPHPELVPDAMTSPHESPIAVFLGPSLPLAEARGLLDARYLPPARFGDVYRLMGSGVDTIVLIDGVFHGHAPVWQRELGYAIESGIRVYGAGSMGALRAAELHAHGMIGIGIVFNWYATDEIDGDDEVALLHEGPEQGYRALSEPLVNLRFNLREAVARGLLEPEQAAALIAALKAMPFWERTVDALWAAPCESLLEEPRRAALRAYFRQEATSLKRRDAAQALLEVARWRDEPRPVEMPASATGADAGTGEAVFGQGYYDRFRLLKRAFPGDHDRPVDGQALVDRLFSDPTRRRLIQRSLGAQFFVRAWASENRISVPASELTAMEAVFDERVVSPSLTAWLRANGLTGAEHREILARHLLWKWLLSRTPEVFGLSPALTALQDEELLPPFPALGVLQPIFDRTSLARALPYLAAWCQWSGAVPGPRATEVLTERWNGALTAIRKRDNDILCGPFLQAVWALEKGPIYFGFATWSPSTELLRELQITGMVARLVSTSEGSVA